MTKLEDEFYTFKHELPKQVGHYEIVKGGQVFFNFTAKPHWWYRFWTKRFLGWTWVDTSQ